jgi:Ca2+-binding RTX toxin-like protein
MRGDGDDTMTGGTGDDSFHFGPGSGRDAIADFSVTNDKVVFEGLPGVDDFDDLTILATAAGHALVRWQDGAGFAQVVLLKKMPPGTLSSDDFACS